jgi:hypothetical protein
MNRQKIVANLIYLILTNVQPMLYTSIGNATPNLEPQPSSPISSSADSSAQGDSAKESLSISEPPTKEKETSFEPRLRLTRNRYSVSADFYSGPYMDSASKTLYLFGLDYFDTVFSGERLHAGLLIGPYSNPFIYGQFELMARNYWANLKSWSYFLRLEIDAAQGLSSLVSLSHYQAGLGITFSLFSELDLSFNAFTTTSRGAGGEIKLSFLVF